ncbi:MAG: F0F1 ATP synthase subunit epsilon [Candidatus Omnitrophica bacterium]|nr:F0F1 ATP synthase subunit epsilon [Candidatus Omnitrophota bacterium]
MGKSFHVDIVSPDGVIYKGETVSLVVPSQIGYMGILADHAPLAASLAKGDIILTDDAGNKKKYLVQNSGIAQILQNNVKIALT